MAWTPEERRRIGLAVLAAREAGTNETDAAAEAARDCLAARGGTMTADMLGAALWVVSDTTSKAPGIAAELREHFSAQGATVVTLQAAVKELEGEIVRLKSATVTWRSYAGASQSEAEHQGTTVAALQAKLDGATQNEAKALEHAATLQAKVEALGDDLEEKDKLIASGEACDRLQADNDRLNSEAREAWAFKSAWKEERDSLRAEVERLKAENARLEHAHRQQAQIALHEMERRKSAESRLVATREELDAARVSGGAARDLLKVAERERDLLRSELMMLRLQMQPSSLERPDPTTLEGALTSLRLWRASARRLAANARCIRERFADDGRWLKEAEAGFVLGEGPWDEDVHSDVMANHILPNLGKAADRALRWVLEGAAPHETAEMGRTEDGSQRWKECALSAESIRLALLSTGVVTEARLQVLEAERDGWRLVAIRALVLNVIVRAQWERYVHASQQAVDGCPGRGKCHGSMSWCDLCGDVGLLCDMHGRCDLHRDRWLEHILEYAPVAKIAREEGHEFGRRQASAEARSEMESLREKLRRARTDAWAEAVDVINGEALTSEEARAAMGPVLSRIVPEKSPCGCDAVFFEGRWTHHRSECPESFDSRRARENAVRPFLQLARDRLARRSHEPIPLEACTRLLAAFNTGEEKSNG